MVLGVAGGIAAYKAAELCRALIQRGFAVQVVMTAAAQQFITPLTFAALTGRKVITGLFSPSTSTSEATLAISLDCICCQSTRASRNSAKTYAHGCYWLVR